MGRYILGEFEHLVLLAILALGDRAYGVSIADTIAERTGQEVAQAAVYLTLRRLEEKGWVEGRVGEPTEDRGGRPRKYMTVTEEGRARLTEARDTLRSLWSAIGQEFSS
ncbi:MAG: helix-turn-helix transcriptional regulator [Longimicrobiales bacterium]